jgi:hypothetical protein
VSEQHPTRITRDGETVAEFDSLAEAAASWQDNGYTSDEYAIVVDDSTTDGKAVVFGAWAEIPDPGDPTIDPSTPTTQEHTE